MDEPVNGLEHFRVTILGMKDSPRAELVRALEMAGARCSDGPGTSDAVVVGLSRPEEAVPLSGPLAHLPVVAVLPFQPSLMSAVLRMGALEVVPANEGPHRVVEALRRVAREARREVAPALPSACEESSELFTAIARTRLPVLLLGETGTGKSHLARELHARLTPDKAFLEVNTSSLGPQLFCSEVFGHERGAFTGAHAAKPGLALLARDGTLFLDEIGELSLESQAQLLSFLDTGRFRPVGGVRENASNTRLVAATNRDLLAMTRAGTFREDLYYRLASLVVRLPSLRQQREKLPDLARRLLEEAAARHRLPPPTLLPPAVQLLCAQAWPGNIRQLRFTLERVAVLFPGEAISSRRLLPLLPEEQPVSLPVSSEVRPLAEMEREMIRRAMQATGGNRTRAAALLGITPRGLYNKLRRGCEDEPAACPPPGAPRLRAVTG